VYGVLDADYPGGRTDLQRAAFRMRQLGLDPILELSRPPRGHLWLMSYEPVEGATMRRLLLGMCRELGLRIKVANGIGLEIFPKQDKVESNRFGNPIRGPLGVHHVTKERYPIGNLVSLKPMEPFTVGGQLVLWDALPKMLPADIKRAAEQFPDHRQPQQQPRHSSGPLDTSGLDILYWAGQLTQLHPMGKVYQGLCPFHEEKTPSFAVYPQTATEKAHFFCFGCETKGDAADLKAKVTGRELGEILREVRAGV
jgi:hypothetical protein